MKVLDFRLRPPLKSFLKCGFFADEGTNPFFWHSELPPSVTQRSWDLLTEELKRAGVEKAVVWGRSTFEPERSTSNDDVVAILHEHPDIFVAGFGGVCPEEDAPDLAVTEAERCAGLGLKGITLEPSFGMRPLRMADDQMFYPLYEYLQSAGLILALTVSRGSPPMQTLDHSNPVAVDRVAGAFPDLKIVISHSFWPWVEQSCGLAFRRRNVFLHPDLYGIGMSGTTAWVEAANTFLQDRLIFGSAYPYLGVQAMVDSYKELPYRSEVREKVMYSNGLRLLGIDE